MATRRKSRRPRAARADPSLAEGVATQLLGAQRKIWNSMGTKAIGESLHGGLKRLEEVFDQRVLSSLERAGMPAPADLSHVLERIEHLALEVEKLKRKLAKRG